jgi:molecular chaperone DnaJ
MAERDYYEILGVPKDAQKDMIKDAYRKLALQYHPDRNKSPEAEGRFKEISEAYAVLSDDEKRREYDSYGKQRIYQEYSPEDLFRGANFADIFKDMGFGGFNDIFSQFFGAGAQRRNRGEDLTYHLQLKLEDVISESTREIETPRAEVCKVCNGSGAKPGTTPRQCQTCGGSGQVQKVQSAGFARLVRVTPCNKCGGRGFIVTSPCKECGGRGNVERTRKISVVIPAGVEDGQTLRLRGEGNAGENGEPPGDLYIMVNIRQHPVFHRQANDVVVELKAGIAEAALGTEASVPTLYGDVKLSIPAGTQPGTVFKVKGKGMPKPGGWGKGDEYVRVQVEVPRNLTDSQKELLKKFSAESS